MDEWSETALAKLMRQRRILYGSVPLCHMYGVAATTVKSPLTKTVILAATPQNPTDGTLLHFIITLIFIAIGWQRILKDQISLWWVDGYHSDKSLVKNLDPIRRQHKEFRQGKFSSTFPSQHKSRGSKYFQLWTCDNRSYFFHTVHLGWDFQRGIRH